MDDAAPRAWLAEFLRDRGGRCPLCRSDLRGVSSAACPGCGRELVLTLGVAEPYLRAWVTGAVATCLSAGVGVVVFAIIAKEGLPPRGQEPWLYWAVWYSLLSVPVAAAWLSARRWFMRLGRAAQRSWALAAVAATVLGLAAFGVGFSRL